MTEKITEDNLENHITDLIRFIGDDPNREGLRGTPKRVIKSLKHLTSGYHQSLADITNGAIFTSDMDEMVIVKDIELYSLCEHHLLPFIGRCHVAYLPEGQVLGLSKVARIVDMFARRLQIQEQLTVQIADCIREVTGAQSVGVIVEAEHMCMMMRGVEKQNSVTKTSAMLGAFRSDARTRDEFLALLQLRSSR